MNAPSKDIKEMIEEMLFEDSSDSLATKYPINRVMFDESKSNCSTILDVPGGSPQLTMDVAKYEFPSIQFKVRCTDYDDGWAFISSVVDLLHGRANETYNGAYYSLIECLNGPGFMGRENQRTIFVANFNLQRREL
jgi:hypothetical protein